MDQEDVNEAPSSASDDATSKQRDATAPAVHGNLGAAWSRGVDPPRSLRSDPKKSTAPRRRRGRRSLLTPAIRDAICENLSQGMSFKGAARAAGVGESTFHQWMSIGARAFEQRAGGKKLTEFEAECADLCSAVEHARSERINVALDVLQQSALHHRKTRSVEGETQIRYKNGILRDDDGNPIWLKHRFREVTEEPNVRAAEAILRYERNAEQVDDPAGKSPDMIEITDAEARLAESIKTRPLVLEDTTVVFQRRRNSPLTTDDEDGDYAYAWWERSIVAPENLEISKFETDLAPSG